MIIKSALGSYPTFLQSFPPYELSFFLSGSTLAFILKQANLTDEVSTAF